MRKENTMRIALAVGLMIATLIANVRTSGATGGFWCKAEDASLTFTAQAGLSHGIDGGFLNFTADLQIKLSDVPTDFKSLHFDEAGVSQRWLDDKEFRLQLYRERQTGTSDYVVFVVSTKAISEGQYHGRYALTVYSMQSDSASKGRSRETRGEVVCSIE
jgi:hypothetical protein